MKETSMDPNRVTGRHPGTCCTCKAAKAAYLDLDNMKVVHTGGMPDQTVINASQPLAQSNHAAAVTLPSSASSTICADSV